MIIPEVKLEISASAISWYAAIVATAAAVISLLNYLRDRPHVFLRYKIGWQIKNARGPYKENTPYIGIDVINKGRRPVVIGNVGFFSFKNKDGIAMDSLIKGARRISEGEKESYLIEQELIDLKNISYFYAYDQTGKVYRIRYAPFLTVAKYTLKKAWKKISN